jgi:type IV pilus assembly protein PilE
MLELVLALAMAAVLAAYAAPIYVSHTARGHRMEAVLALHRAAQYVAVSASAAGHPFALPPGLDRSPEHGRTVYRLETVSKQDRGVRSNRSPTGDGARLDACWSGRPA